MNLADDSHESQVSFSLKKCKKKKKRGECRLYNFVWHFNALTCEFSRRHMVFSFCSIKIGNNSCKLSSEEKFKQNVKLFFWKKSGISECHLLIFQISFRTVVSVVQSCLLSKKYQ